MPLRFLQAKKIIKNNIFEKRAKLFLMGIKARWAVGGVTILFSDKSGGVITLDFGFHLDPQLTRSILKSGLRKIQLRWTFET